MNGCTRCYTKAKRNGVEHVRYPSPFERQVSRDDFGGHWPIHSE